MQKKQVKPLAGKVSGSAKIVEVPVDPEALRKLKRWMGILIAVFALVLYAQTVSFKYTLDDTSVVRYNALTRQGIKGIPALMTTDYWYGFKTELRVPQYRPASLVMFAIEWQFFPDNPHFAHLMNVLFYALTCWLLFLLLCKLFEKQTLLFPFVCALLYTAHPLHSEVVSNIKSLDEIFCFLFGILCFYFLLKNAEKKSTGNFIAAAACYFVALLSKETAVSFLILIPILLFVFTKSDSKNILKTTLVFIGVTVVFFFIWYQIYKAIPIQVYNSPLNNSMLSTTDFVSQRATAFYILLRYVFLLIFPITLSYDYSLAQVPLQEISSPEALLGILLYFFIGIYALLKIRKKSYIAFAILFFLLTLVPVSNVFLLIGATMAERFLYMPSLGFCLLLTFLLLKISGAVSKGKSSKKGIASMKQLIGNHSTLFLFVFIVLGLYSAKTIARSAVWKDNITLFGHDIKVADKSARAHFNWGAALIYDLYPEEKDADKKKVVLEKATKELTTAISIFSGHPDSYKTLAYCYELKKDFVSEIKIYETLITLDKRPDTTVYYNLAFAYSKNGEYDKALSFLDSTTKYSANSAKVFNIRGFCYLNKSMPSEAIREYEKAVKINPTDPEAYANIGAAHLNKNEPEEAIKFCERAIQIDSSYAKAYCYLGRTYSTLKQYPEAIRFLNKSHDLDSTDEECLKFLSITYISIGDTASAVSYFEKANRLKSGQ